MNNLGGSNKLLSLREAAGILGLAEGTLHNRWKAWGLRFYRPSGALAGPLRIKERDLWNWLETRKAA